MYVFYVRRCYYHVGNGAQSATAAARFNRLFHEAGQSQIVPTGPALLYCAHRLVGPPFLVDAHWAWLAVAASIPCPSHPCSRCPPATPRLENAMVAAAHSHVPPWRAAQTLSLPRYSIATSPGGGALGVHHPSSPQALRCCWRKEAMDSGHRLCVCVCASVCVCVRLCVVK